MKKSLKKLTPKKPTKKPKDITIKELARAADTLGGVLKIKLTPKTGLIFAIKKNTRAPAFMPDAVIVLLDGEPKGKLLMTCGWALPPPRSCKRWPITRLQLNLERLREEWCGEHGKSWLLEIRV